MVFKGAQPCRAIRHSALEIPEEQYDLIYIDPPYLRQDRWNDNYLHHYHFLEGLSQYEHWAGQIDYDSPHLRLKERTPNIWANKYWRSDALDVLIEKFPRSVVVVSYKKFGVPSIDSLMRLLKRHRSRVRSYSQHYKYALNHQNGEAHLNREVLLIAE